MAARYSRQTVLPEIGEDGQALLGRARVLVVGAGGLGAPALLYLAAAGVGRAAHGGKIGVVDDDEVEISNLQRQILYVESDQHRAKTAAAAQRLTALNHEVEVVAHQARLTSNNVLRLFDDYDIVIDGSDNFDTKYLINDAAVKTGKPVVYGSIIGFEGQVAVFAASRGPCYRCLYPEPVRTHIPNCAEAGTIGSLAGIVGSMQALEACKLALGETHCRRHGLDLLLGRLLTLDARSWDVRLLALDRNPACPVCSRPPAQIRLAAGAERACTSAAIRTITRHELGALQAAQRPVMLVDVRDVDEWEAGHLDRAIHIPLQRLLSEDGAVQQLQRDALIVLYCQHGIRSLHAARYLSGLGFEALTLRGGGS